MKWLLIIALLIIPQTLLAEMVFLRVLDVEGVKLVTASETYALGEECVIKNRKGKDLTLSDIRLPATAKGDAELVNDSLVLNWLIVTDEKNNLVVPE